MSGRLTTAASAFRPVFCRVPAMTKIKIVSINKWQVLVKKHNCNLIIIRI
jgi:hypothetical protein